MLTRENMNKYEETGKKMQHTFHSQTQAEKSVTEETGTGKERRLLGKIEYCMLR